VIPRFLSALQVQTLRNAAVGLVKEFKPDSETLSVFPPLSRLGIQIGISWKAEIKLDSF
jgi:hypothetical protein